MDLFLNNEKERKFKQLSSMIHEQKRLDKKRRKSRKKRIQHAIRRIDKVSLSGWLIYTDRGVKLLRVIQRSVIRGRYLAMVTFYSIHPSRSIPSSIMWYPTRAIRSPVGIAIRPSPMSNQMSKKISKKIQNFLSNFFEYVYMLFGVMAVILVVCGGVYGIVDLIL